MSIEMKDLENAILYVCRTCKLSMPEYSFKLKRGGGRTKACLKCLDLEKQKRANFKSNRVLAIANIIEPMETNGSTVEMLSSFSHVKQNQMIRFSSSEQTLIEEMSRALNKFKQAIIREERNTQPKHVVVEPQHAAAIEPQHAVELEGIVEGVKDLNL